MVREGCDEDLSGEEGETGICTVEESQNDNQEGKVELNSQFDMLGVGVFRAHGSTESRGSSSIRGVFMHALALE